MRAELDQLMTCRLERENRAAAALRRARGRLAHLQAAVEAARTRLADHERARRERQDRLYRRSLRNRMSVHQIDDLNIELDLMAEQTDALKKRLDDAGKSVEQAKAAVAEAAAHYRRRRHDSERWGHLVDDIAENERRRAEQMEEFAIEDDLGDRRAADKDGFG